MRYETPVRFIKEEDKFNYDNGNTETTIVKDTTILANVTDTSAELCNLMYGKVKNETYTIIIQNNVSHAFDCILMNDKRYTVDRTRKLRTTTTFFVSGGA